MISKAKIKFIRSLALKKNRLEAGLFVAEGPKIVSDLMTAVTPKLIVATEEWTHASALESDTETISVTEEELRKVSFLQHPQQVLGLFPLPNSILADASEFLKGQLTLALDGVQDPGNVGTIIRIADWFGIPYIFCSEGTADAFSPKVVQATMGSLARVKVIETSLTNLIGSLPKAFPVYVTSLDGNTLYEEGFSHEGLIVMGNEGNGVCASIRQMANHHVLIPSWPAGRQTADSLNVAVATAIVCAEFRRRME